MTSDMTSVSADHVRAKPAWRWITSDQPRFDVSSITVDDVQPYPPAVDPFRDILVVQPPDGTGPRKVRVSGRFLEAVDLMTVHAHCEEAKWTIDVSIAGRGFDDRSSLSFSAGGTAVSCGAIELPAAGDVTIDLRLSCDAGTSGRRRRTGWIAKCISAIRAVWPMGSAGKRIEASQSRPAAGPAQNPQSSVSLRLHAVKRTRLSSLADAYGTDKGFLKSWNIKNGAHAYTEAYEQVFAAMEGGGPGDLLEIGLYTPSTMGAPPSDAPSLRMWRDYLQAARIVGLDMLDFSEVHIEGATILRGDQGDRESLAKALSSIGQPSFSVIIDDGSHRASHQQITLGALFSAVRPGGWYVIEDLCWQPLPETPRTLDLMTEFCTTGELRSSYLLPHEADFLAREIAEVVFARPHTCEMVFLRRRQ